MEKIATDIYTFEKLRKDGYVYVDKTDLLWRLATKKDGDQFFISRLRRFGKSQKFVWVFEFKYNMSAKVAVRQIREKGYADQYRGDTRPVTLVGINFRNAKRNIDEALFEEL